MKKWFFLLWVFSSFSNFIFAQKELSYSLKKFNTVSGLTIRAIYAVNDTTVWFAANRGVWGYSEDAGKTFHIDSIKIDSHYPEFRSIAVLNDSTVLLLSIASPAYLLKTTNKGKTWRQVYTNTHKNIFFDCLQFKDAKNGIAIGDPIDSIVQMIYTKDGGETWKEMENPPRAFEKESFFACSNSSLKMIGKRIWIGTGGENTRVLLSKNGGKTFTSSETSILEGSEMSGIFSMDFYDKKNGAVVGGHYDKENSQYCILDITHDGGKTWECIKFPELKFGSCVQFFKKNELFITSRKNTFHIDLDSRKITELKDSLTNELSFPTFRIAPSKKVIWLGGTNGEIGRILLLKD